MPSVPSAWNETQRGILVMLVGNATLPSVRARDRNSAEEGLLMGVATSTKRWTLRELHSLPDDGNKYELIRGKLFVTPPPTDPHETIAAKLSRILDPYVAAHNLGFVYHPRAVLQYKGSEAEPDLMVRRAHPNPKAGWAKAPIPILVVEILSPSTRRRDREDKRSFYMDAGVAEYWIVDPEEATITVVRRGRPDLVSTDHLTWTPRGAAAALTFDMASLFH